MLYYILSAVILMCLGLIVYIGVRKMRQIKDIPAGEEVKDKLAETKKRLLEIKLKKNLVEFFTKLVLRVIGFLGRIKMRKFFVGHDKNKEQAGLTEILKQGKDKKDMMKINKNEAENRLLSAKTELKKREINAAEDEFIKVLKYDPKNIEAYMGLGKIYAMRRDYETAEEAYRYIIKIDKKNYDGHKELSNLFKLQKKWEELKTTNQELLDAHHEEPWVLVNIGVAFRKTGYPEKAEEYFRRAVEIEPQNEALLDYLIEVAIINKNKSLAVRCLNTLTTISSDQMKLQDYRNKIDII